MRRATPLGHEPHASATDAGADTNTAPAETPAADDQQTFARPFSVLRGGAPAEPRDRASEQRRRMTAARALIQPSDPERLHRALEAMREMNKLTRRRTQELRKLSELSRQLSSDMTAFGAVIGGLKINPAG